MRPETLTGLYWSIRGEVACAEHAPGIEDPRWFLEGWAPIPLASGQNKRSRYQCQHCTIDGHVVVRVFSGQPN